MVSRSSRLLRRLLPLAGLSFALGCGRPGAAEIELELGSERFRFVPRAAFAEYWELPGEADQLRITLASYSTFCERHRPPGDGEVLVVLTVRSPAGKPLNVGDYPWNGAESPLVAEPEVIPFVRLSHEGRALPPGGGLRLTKLERSVHGVVEANFAFAPPRAEGADVPSAPTTGGLRGSVRTRLCRVSADASRKAEDSGVLRP